MDSAPSRKAHEVDPGELVRRAAAGDRGAWECLVDRYVRLIWSITRDFKLSPSDAADVTQVTWLRLLEHINRLDDPSRVGSWLATTARRECLRILAARRRVVLTEDDEVLDGLTAVEEVPDAALIADETARDVRAAIARLPLRWQQLMAMLMADPAPSYAEISQQLGLPIGSIGPTRGRCLERLRVMLQAS